MRCFISVEEFNTSSATRRTDSEFGIVLLIVLRPGAGRHVEALLHRCQLCLRTDGPMETVVDETEMDRTERISKPVRADRGAGTKQSGVH
jgi:hypothetical protein